jgi:ribonuclease VapC
VKLKTDGAQYVLDSSALIALIRREPGWETVDRVLDRSVLCAVNLTETITKLIRKGADPALTERYLRGLELEVLPWDETLAWESRDLAPLAWTHGISLADRACLGLARQLGLSAMTSDATWKHLGLRTRVTLFR